MNEFAGLDPRSALTEEVFGSESAERLEPGSATPARPFFDYYNAFARSRGAPEGWQWFELKVLGIENMKYDEINNRPDDQAYSQMMGGVCNVVFKSGKRKGKSNWSKRDRTADRTLIFSRAEINAFLFAHCEHHGWCFECVGRGAQCHRAGDDGIFYVACKKCSGSGNAQNVENPP